jgi:hypothetical protein
MGYCPGTTELMNSRFGQKIDITKQTAAATTINHMIRISLSKGTDFIVLLEE